MAGALDGPDGPDGGVGTGIGFAGPFGAFFGAVGVDADVEAGAVGAGELPVDDGFLLVVGEEGVVPVELGAGDVVGVETVDGMGVLATDGVCALVLGV